MADENIKSEEEKENQGGEQPTNEIEELKKQLEAERAEKDKLVKSNQNLLNTMVSPEYFEKMRSAAKPKEPEKEEKKIVMPTEQEVDSMSNTQLLNKAVEIAYQKARTDISKEYANKLKDMESRINQTMSARSTDKAESAIDKLIAKVGEEEYEKHRPAMHRLAQRVKGASIDEYYEWVTGKKVPRYPKPAPAPNNTEKPVRGGMPIKEKDLKSEEAAQAAYKDIFGE